MRHLLLSVIRGYWKLIPEHERRHCLFKESCSRFVYRITLTQGIKAGVLAFNQRFHQCRPGYRFVKNEKRNMFELHLKDGTILRKDEISTNLFVPGL